MKLRTILLLGLLVIAVVAGAAYLGMRSIRPQTEVVDVAPLSVDVTRGDVSQTVTAPGLLVQNDEMALGMEVAGRLAALYPRVGDVVRAGDELARLETANLEEALWRAETQLERAQADHEHQLAAARLSVEELEARLEQAQSKEFDLAAAEATLAAAQAALNELLAGPDADQLAVLTVDLRRAEINVQQAQWEYDKIAWQEGAGAFPQAAQLEQATLEYETAKARYNLEAGGPTTSEIARARASVAQAQAEIDNLGKQALDNQNQIALLEIDLTRARLTLDTLETGIDPTLAHEVELARENLEKAPLTAPADGVVLEVLAMPGQMVSAGEPIVRMADPSDLEVVVEVIEEDLPLVEIGQPVELYFDAYLGDAVAGRVSRIVPRRIPNENRPLYAVYLTPDIVPEELVAGMTADASIIIDQRTDVLRLPRALVRARADGSATITLWENGRREARTIQTGLRGDVYVEVIDGLREGEQVVSE